MSVIIMKQTAVGRRAYAISRVEADKLVADGKAIQDKVHTGIYEEVTDDEVSQGYMTRNMLPLDVPAMPLKGGKGRAQKPRSDEA